MRVRILGKVWRLEFCDRLSDRGRCDSPTTKAKAIRVWSGLKGQEELEVLLHEMLHAAFWQVDEEFIDGSARDISAALYRLGYRKTGGSTDAKAK